MAERTPVVCLSALPWEGLQTSRHHLARCLSGEREVLFVDPPTNVMRAGGRWRPSITATSEGVHRLSPPPHLPYGPTALFRATTPFNQRIYARAVAAAVRSLGWRQPVLWNANLVYLAPLVAEAVQPSVHLFHLTDSIWDYPWYRPAYEGYLTRIMATASFGVASSPALTERLAAYGKPAHHLPHGVDPARFAPAAVAGEGVPTALEQAERPRYGFVGNIEARLDIDLVCRLAATPGSVTLVGPVNLPRSAVDRLLAAGCAIQPQIAYRDVPAWLSGFDVGLLPYRRSELVVKSRPLKLLEYLAAGLPVVSPDIPAAVELSPHVDTAGSDDEFIERAQQAGRRVLNGDDAPRRAERMERASRESWDERAKALNCLIETAEEMR